MFWQLILALLLIAHIAGMVIIGFTLWITNAIDNKFTWDIRMFLGLLFWEVTVYCVLFPSSSRLCN